LKNITEDQIRFLKAKNYLADGETINDRLDAIGNVLRGYEEMYQEEGFADRFINHVKNRYIVLSTPQLGNVGVPV